MTASESAFAPLRRRERQRWIAELRQRLCDTLGPNDCSVWLYSCGEAFGYSSLALGDWAGFPDTDLLVVAANQDAAERAADQLMKALVGDDLLAIDHKRWQAMAHSPSPHWRDDALADAQLRSMARHWGRNLTRLAPVAARW
jgi:hypothetical protein